MAKKTVFYKTKPFLITVDDRDSDLLTKSWIMDFTRDGSKKLKTRCDYHRVKRNLSKEEKKVLKRHHMMLHHEVWDRHNPGTRLKGLVINHINNDPKDNRLSNLELITQKENMSSAKRQKRVPKCRD